ncbi:hypothetical protein Dda_2295 [Drechslerella dactyloides]|uniref:Kelch repeat protein n=1 Tax=Drechslerella dactyloides TaxID=74499 RepID=A0AAD6NMW2_DREDA|nr:hypothetical protein Dda_2295 [Drechslerella dactyloides]
MRAKDEVPIVLCSQTSLGSLIFNLMAIINDTLYFTSGSYVFNTDIRFASDPKIHKINLASNLNVNGLIPRSQVETEDAPDQVTSQNGIGTFFYNNEALWAYAAIQRDSGVSDQVNQTNMMWKYETSSDSWSEEEIAGGELQWFNQTNGFSATTPDGRSFYGGGQGSGLYGRDGGLVLFEANTTPPRWSFIPESDSAFGVATPSTLNGAIVYLPVGEQGILVLMGGYDTTKRGNLFKEGSGLDFDPRPLSDIYIYDIAANIWNVITATGDSSNSVPTARTEFCIVANSSPDGSYHNIVFYGGWSQLLGKTFADVWVLSLPAFQWIKVDDENNPDTRITRNDLNNIANPNVGRTRHKCNLYKDNQMIVTGGIVSQVGDLKLNIDACNSSHPPILVLDTNTFVWKASVDPEGEEYRVPGVVRNSVRNQREPSDGWPNTRLENLFSSAISTTASSSTSAPTSNTTGGPDDSTTGNSAAAGGSNSGISTGAIVGIAVGCVLGVALLLVGGFFFWRHKTPRARPLIPAPYEESSDASGHGYGGLLWPKPELSAEESRAELPNNNDLRAELPTTLNNHELPA